MPASKYRVIIFSLALALLASAVLFSQSHGLSSPKVILNSLFGRSGADPTAESVARWLTPAPGYAINLFAKGIPNARWLAVTAAGDLLVSAPRENSVYLLQDEDQDGVAEVKTILIDHLNLPHGLALHQGWLYIAETDAVGRIRFDAESGATQGNYERIITGIPGRGNHGKRYIGFDADGQLYLSVGSSCNACKEANPLRASLLRYNADGGNGRTIATGLRSITGFDWAPWNNALYVTENGRDWLGDNFPPDELNLIREGGFYGWPYFNGNNVPDPDWGDQDKEFLPRNPIPPVYSFRAHNAPLGITFLKNDPDLKRTALVALHGSWNRSKPDGYKVVALTWAEDGSIISRDFLTGFLQREKGQNSRVIGRPVHLVEGLRGEMYLSDDFANAVYRITRKAGDS